VPERQQSVIPLLHPVAHTDPATARALEQLRQEVQHYLQLLAERVDTQAGIRGTPRLYADLDGGGMRLTNIAMPAVGTDAQRADQALSLDKTGASYDAGNRPIINIPRATAPRHAVPLEQLDEDMQQVLVSPTILGNATITGDLTLGGAFDHNGATFGALGTTPVAQHAAQANVTGTAGGATNGAMEAIADPADAPATADALRDDLVANALPSIRNNIDEVRILANKAMDVLRTFGLMAP